MLLIDSTAKTLEVVLAAGVVTQLPIVVDWVDIANGAQTSITDTTTTTNNTTAVTVVPASTAGTTRQVKFLSVRNGNSAAVIVKLQLNDNGTARIIVAVSLAQDETLLYIDGLGVQVLNWNGEQKESQLLINLTTQVTGVLPVANGGTGDATLAAHGVLVGNGTSAVAVTGTGTSGQVLMSNGASADPTFQDNTATGTVTHTAGALTANQVVIGNGTADLKTLGSLGTTTTVLHGNAAGAPSFGAVSLTADVSGTLAAGNGGTGKTSLPITSTLTDGATPALDASLIPAFLTGVYRLAAAGDRTIAVPSNATDGQKIIIEHFASGAGRTLALNSGAGGFRFGSDITSLSQTASGKTDYIGCVYNGTDSKWDVVAVTKGF